MHVHLCIGRDIVYSQGEVVVQVSYNSTYSIIVDGFVGFPMVGHLTVTDDDVADFCILCHVGSKNTQFDHRASYRYIILFLFDTCILDEQVGNRCISCFVISRTVQS